MKNSSCRVHTDGERFSMIVHEGDRAPHQIEVAPLEGEILCKRLRRSMGLHMRMLVK